MPGARAEPPSVQNPPDWLRELQGFEWFAVQSLEKGWKAMPLGMDEDVEFPGGTWKATMLLPHDLTITDGFVDPLVLLVLLANGVAQVEDKIEELVAYCRGAGKSWTQIGRALGTTKQAAWERFSGED